MLILGYCQSYNTPGHQDNENTQPVTDADVAQHQTEPPENCYTSR